MRTFLTLCIACLIALTPIASANAKDKQDIVSGNLAKDIIYSRKTPPPTLTLRPIFQAFKDICIAQAPRLIAERKPDVDGDAASLCGCMASHAQIKGVPENVMGELIARVNAGDWLVSGKHARYEYIVDYCFGD